MADDTSTGGAPTIDVLALGAGRYRVSLGGLSRIAYAAGPRHARWVFLDGRVYVVDADGQGVEEPRPIDERMALASPMPARVAVIHVTNGQSVASGDLLVTLEAMKMELPVRAPRDGTVTAVRCSPGEIVPPGVPLVELD